LQLSFDSQCFTRNGIHVLLCSRAPFRAECIPIKNVENSHNIVADGYNIGRDALAAAAVGDKSFENAKYGTTEKRLTGLLPPGSQGVNHGELMYIVVHRRVMVAHARWMEGIATDGVTVLLTVTIE
jgi:hypothetical protein